MATKEQVDLVLEHLEKVNPMNFIKEIGDTKAGARALLRYLYESKEDVTAGSISSFLHISTARVAVLLKKLEQRGFITRECDANDARITIVRLTIEGVERNMQLREEMHAKVASVIDKIGMERIIEFLTISAEIRDAIAPSETDGI